MGKGVGYSVMIGFEKIRTVHDDKFHPSNSWLSEQFIKETSLKCIRRSEVPKMFLEKLHCV